MPAGGGESGAGDNQVGAVVGYGQVVEEARDHPDVMPMVRR